MNFINFLVERIDNMDNEADMVLHQVVDNVDEAHVNYEDGRLDFNIGIMIKRSGYSRLYMTILDSETNSIRLAKNTDPDKGGYTIVINTTEFPARTDIDKLLMEKLYKGVKQEIMRFIETYQNKDDEDFKTTYESDKEINTPEKFEAMYKEVTSEMEERIKDYKGIARGINFDIDNTYDEAKKATLVRSLNTLRDEYFGDTFKKFKKIAGEDLNIDLTRFNKEYKAKFDNRLEDFYQYIIKTS